MENTCTIKNECENLIVINKSKFFAYTFKVTSETEVKTKLDYLSTKNPDATHICYAYNLGSQQKCSDAGEPQGTAGKPILDCILKKKLCYVLVAVVRYFGGIKLGAGGLVRAYSTSASQVLALSEEKQIVPCVKLKFNINYDQLSSVETALKKDYVKFEQKTFNECVEVVAVIEKEYQYEFENLINTLLSTKSKFILLDENYSY